ncbi:hypothetical protein GH714_026413 [Hevea brasiliensis]|uniref:Uncharacterized protein n=1 Tax=Hevea brasiliensis TaxID=3981 RepID=A0A6A6KMB2_HEVBR|nr:hypothetical protein GH714_026413 [Hevea brasiliensis]
MEGRVDSVEKNITDLQQLVSAMKLEQEQCMSSFQAVQDQRFSRIESLLSSMALGKSTVQEVDPSLQSPTHGTSTVHPVTPPAIVDAVGTSTLYLATQPVVVNDSSLAIKKVELPTLMGGLRDDIRVRIHSQDSTDIFRTMTLARELELENQFLLQSASQLKRWNDSGIRWSPPGFSPKLDMGKQSYGASVITKTQPISSVSKLQELPVQKSPDHNSSGPAKPSFLPTTTTPPRPSSTFSRNRGTRHYTHQEFLDLRAKGLCYKCKQPFHPMHECPNKSLRALIIGDDEEKPPDPDLSLSELDPPQIEVINEAHFNTMDLPFYSIGGISSPKTLKLQGKMHGTDVTVLIDSGASHNFIAGNLSSKLNLMVESTPSFGVRLGDGHRVQSMGVSTTSNRFGKSESYS